MFFYLFIGVLCMERCRLSQIRLEGNRSQTSSEEIQSSSVLISDEERHQTGPGSQPSKIVERADPRNAEPGESELVRMLQLVRVGHRQRLHQVRAQAERAERFSLQRSERQQPGKNCNQLQKSGNSGLGRMQQSNK